MEAKWTWTVDMMPQRTWNPFQMTTFNGRSSAILIL